MPLAPKPPSASATEMVQVVLPNDANPMGFMLGGAVMHLIDIAGAIAAFRHAHELMVTAAVDGLEFLNPIKVGDFIVLKARVTAMFTTSLEVEVTVFSEEALTGRRQMTSRAYLTFVTLEQRGQRARKFHRCCLKPTRRSGSRPRLKSGAPNTSQRRAQTWKI